VAAPSVAILTVALRLGAGLDVEVAGGELPTSGRGESELSATGTVVPRLRLLEDVGDGLFQLTYFPRLFYRYPDSLLLGRPTLLHQIASAYSVPLDRVSQFSLAAAAAYGETDFTATSAVFGEGQVVAPEDAVTQTTRISGGPSASTRIDRRTTLRLTLPAGYQVLSGRTTALARTTWNAGVTPA
jgi:hypothetical protein